MFAQNHLVGDVTISLSVKELHINVFKFKDFPLSSPFKQKRRGVRCTFE